MGKLTVNLKIEWAKPSYTPADFAAVEAWLKTNIMSKLPSNVSGLYTWHNQTTIIANVILEWTKAEFLEADFTALKTWIDTNVIGPLPANANASYFWTVSS